MQVRASISWRGEPSWISSLMKRTGIVLASLFYWPFSHVTRLLTRENFIVFIFIKHISALVVALNFGGRTALIKADFSPIWWPLWSCFAVQTEALFILNNIISGHRYRIFQFLYTYRTRALTCTHLTQTFYMLCKRYRVQTLTYMTHQL